MIIKYLFCRGLNISGPEYDFLQNVRVEVDQSVDFVLAVLVYAILFIFFFFFRLSSEMLEPLWFARSGALLVIFAVVVNLYSGMRRRKSNRINLKLQDVPEVMVLRWMPVYRSKYGYLTYEDAVSILLEKYIRKAEIKRSINQQKLLLTEVVLALLGTFIWAFGDLLVGLMVGNLTLIVCCDIVVILTFLKILIYDVDPDVKDVFNSVLGFIRL